MVFARHFVCAALAFYLAGCGFGEKTGDPVLRQAIAQKFIVDFRYYCPDLPAGEKCEDPVTELQPELPPILDSIIRKAMEKDPPKRYQTCMDMAYDLRVALRGLTETFLDGKIKDAVDYIHHAPFFQNFTREQVKELLTACTITKFPKGKVIVAEGDIDDTFYIILSGNATIRKNGVDVATISTGECFGEMAYISGQARTATVLAGTDCILTKINASLMDKSSTEIQLLFYKNFSRTLVNRFSS